MDIESYIEKSIPTEQITSDLLVDPAPRKKMQDSLEKAHKGRNGPGGKSQGRSRPRNQNRNSGNRRRKPSGNKAPTTTG
jgi:hypothetical protein